MQIHSVSNSELNVRSAETRALTRPPPVERLDGSTETESTGETFPSPLDAAPEVRPEAVARARELYQQVAYPPTEIMQGISRLIARHWDGV